MTLDLANLMPGFYKDVPDELYHSLPGFIGSSVLGEQTMQHVLASLTRPKKPTDQMKLGTCIHLANHQWDEFKARVVCGPSVRRNTTEWKAFAEAHPGKIILKAAEYERVLATAERINAHPVLKPLRLRAIPEATILWYDDASGLSLKCRPDEICLDGDEFTTYLEYKTTDDASIAAFSRTIEDYRYHARIAMYLDGMNQVLGERERRVIIIAAEPKYPYLVEAYEPARDPRYGVHPLEVGFRDYRTTMAKIAACMRNNDWPGYSEDAGTRAIHLPNYVNRRESLA